MKKAHYRPTVGDYRIQTVANGSIYIKPQARGLVITCNPNVEAALTALLGEPTDRESPETQDYAKWEILK